MKRKIPGLCRESQNGADGPEGVFLVRVEQAIYKHHYLKPFYTVRFVILEPQSHAQREFSGRLYCSERALWKLNWFLRDFGYDEELLGRDEIDDQALKGLRGVIKVSRAHINGHAFVSLDGFTPAEEWQETAPLSSETEEIQEAHHDL